MSLSKQIIDDIVETLSTGTIMKQLIEKMSDEKEMRLYSHLIHDRIMLVFNKKKDEAFESFSRKFKLEDEPIENDKLEVGCDYAMVRKRNDDVPCTISFVRITEKTIIHDKKCIRLLPITFVHNIISNDHLTINQLHFDFYTICIDDDKFQFRTYSAHHWYTLPCHFYKLNN